MGAILGKSLAEKHGKAGSLPARPSPPTRRAARLRWRGDSASISLPTEPRQTMTTTTERDCIEIKTVPLHPEQSDVEANRYVFAYHITIRNTGSVAAQL
jgi:hypothetical protein